jgi:hypothetical protein
MEKPKASKGKKEAVNMSTEFSWLGMKYIDMHYEPSGPSKTR